MGKCKFSTKITLKSFRYFIVRCILKTSVSAPLRLAIAFINLSKTTHITHMSFSWIFVKTIERHMARFRRAISQSHVIKSCPSGPTRKQMKPHFNRELNQRHKAERSQIQSGTTNSKFNPQAHLNFKWLEISRL